MVPKIPCPGVLLKMRSNEIHWNRLTSHEIPKDQTKSIKVQWNRVNQMRFWEVYETYGDLNPTPGSSVKSRDICWNQMRPTETEWTPLKSNKQKKTKDERTQNLRKSNEISGCPTKPNEINWNLMRPRRTSWNTTNLHETKWNAKKSN